MYRPDVNESMPTELWQLVRPAEWPSGGLCRWWARPGGVCGPECDGDLPGFGFALPTGGMYPYGTLYGDECVQTVVKV